MIVCDLAVKHARCRIIVEQFGERWSWGADLDYNTGNHHSSGGSPSPASAHFRTREDAEVRAVARALLHFNPRSLSPHDSCVNVHQRAAALAMTAELHKFFNLAPDAPPAPGTQLSLF